MLPHDKATELHTFTASSTAVLSADQSRAQEETLEWAQNVDAGLHHTSTATRVSDGPITWKTQPGDIVYVHFIKLCPDAQVRFAYVTPSPGTMTGMETRDIHVRSAR